MTNAAFNTETAKMQVAAEHVREVNSRVQASLTSMLNRLEALYATWAGEAAASFHHLKQRWHDDATKLNDTLMRISEALDYTRKNYQDAEEINRTGFAGIAGKL